MTSKMITCPHCGTANSERKETCYECQQALGTRKSVVRKPLARATEPAVPGGAIDSPAIPVQRMLEQAPPDPAAVAGKKVFRAPGIIGVSVKQRVQMYRQLQSLLKAGIPVGMCLNYLHDNVAKYLRPMVKDMAEYVQAGGVLSQSMARYNSIFPEWEINVIRAAEKSGQLPEAVASISETLEMEMEMRYKINVTMIPLQGTALMFLLTILIVWSVSQGTMAAGAETVDPMASTLAHVGQALLRFIELVAAIILARFAWQFYGRSRRGSRVQQAVIQRTPMIGAILRLQMLYRFVEVLGALWKAGVAPIDALESAARASDNRLLVYRITDQRKKFSDGTQLSEILEETRMLPKEVIYMVRSGEASGAIGESLERVAEYIRMELEAQVKSLPVRVQLVMYAVIGTAVGWFVIWFWSQYYEKMFSSLGM